MRTTRTTRVCVGDAPCTRAPTRTRAPRRTRCAATPRPLCLPPRPLPTTHAPKHPVHTRPSPRPSRRPPRAWPSLGVAPAATPTHAVPVPAARLRAAHCAPPCPCKQTPRPRSHQTLPPDTRPSATRAWPSLGVAPAATPAHAVPMCPPPARLRGAPALARHCAGVPSQRASQLAAALRRARPMPSLPSHGDAPAPGARPAVTLPAGRCPPPARALHACAAPLPSHGVAPAPGPGTRLPRPSPPPPRCPPSLSRIPMGAAQPGEDAPPEDGRPTP